MSSNIQIVSFFIDNRFYGLDIRIVKEITPFLRISLVPWAPPHLRGLVNIRGQVVLVMDIAVIFGRAHRPVTDSSHIVILKTASEIQRVTSIDSDNPWYLFGSKPFGILVDKIGDVIQVPAHGIEATPRHIEEDKARFFSGVFNLAEELLMLLDAGEILSYGAHIPAIESPGKGY